MNGNCASHCGNLPQWTNTVKMLRSLLYSGCDKTSGRLLVLRLRYCSCGAYEIHVTSNKFTPAYCNFICLEVQSIRTLGIELDMEMTF